MSRVQTYERDQLRLVWAARTETGKVRRHNEDSLIAEPGLYAVADGMGGHTAGDVASRIVVERLSALRTQVPLAVDAVDEMLAATNNQVREHARTLDGGVMGTTLVAAVLVENAGRESLVVVNIGDSRCYVCDSRGLRILTHDHSLVQELVDAGQITPTEARQHPDRNVVTRAIGVDDYVVPDYVVLESVPEQRLLLCSDGVSGQVDDEFLASVLGSDLDPGAAVDAILDRVLAGRAPDNVTAIVVDVDWSPEVLDDDLEITGPRSVAAQVPPAALPQLAAPVSPLIDAVPGSPHGEVDRADPADGSVSTIDEVPK